MPAAALDAATDAVPSVGESSRAARWLEQRWVWVAVVLGAVATVARLLYWYSTRSRPLSSDAGQYHEIASNLSNGLGFVHSFPAIDNHPTAFRPPLYPFLLSLVYRVFGDDAGVGRATSVVIGVAVVVAVFFVVRRYAGVLAATTAAGLVAVYPPIVANDTTTLTEGLSLLLIVALLDAVLRKSWVLTGLWCGLLTLARPSAQFLVVVLAVWFVVKVDWRRALLVVLTTVVIVMPWVARNAVEVGEPVIVSSNGFNLAALYSPEAQASGQFVDAAFDPRFDDIRLTQFDEARWDRTLQRRALDNLKRNPAQVAPVIGRNTLLWFELTPGDNENAERLDMRNITVRNWSLPLFYLVTVVGIIGLVLARRNDLAVLSLLIGVLFTLASLVFVAPPRLRAPFDLVCCIGVGLLVAHIVATRTSTEVPAEPLPSAS